MPGKKKAIASMIFGIAGVCGAWWYIGAITGLIFGIVALCLASSAAKEGNKSGFRKAGFVTGLISVIAGGVIFACSAVTTIACAGEAMGMFGGLM